MNKTLLSELAEKLILLNEINKEKLEYISGFIDAKIEDGR